MSKRKLANKVTSVLSQTQKQELYKNARSEKYYQDIWQNVGKCVFCDLNSKYILHEENNVVLTINLYPYIDGQLMAIPRRHVSSLKDLTQIEWETMRKFSYIAKKIIRSAHNHKAVWNLVREGGESAQMTVSDHLHMQLIPFDSKDLATWNFRKLKYTPLENVAKYKQAYEEFKQAYTKFDKKYSQKTSRDIVVDLLIIHELKVLLQERKNEFKFSPDVYTLPGGHVNHDDLSLLDALKREVKEEINYEFSFDDVELINSQLGKIKQNVSIMDQVSTSKSLNFIWNTYLLTNFDKTQDLSANDDCERLHWVHLKDVLDHKHISADLKKIILKTAIKL